MKIPSPRFIDDLDYIDHGASDLAAAALNRYLDRYDVPRFGRGLRIASPQVEITLPPGFEFDDE